MITQLFAGVGAFVIFGLLAAGLVIAIAHLTTSKNDKQQNGGPDLSWFVLAGLVGFGVGCAAFGIVAF